VPLEEPDEEFPLRPFLPTKLHAMTIETSANRANSFFISAYTRFLKFEKSQAFYVSAPEDVNFLFQSADFSPWLSRACYSFDVPFQKAFSS
jgi:hypothetical protein